MNKKLKDKKIPKGKRKNFIKEIFCVNNKFDFIALLRNILIPVIGGFLIGLITKGSMSTYDSLRKSMFNPPAIVFQIVWGVLYFLMGIASYRIYMNNKYGKNDYNLRLYGISFILTILLLILIIITTIKFFKCDKIAGIFMIPYILGVTFSSYLTLYIWIFNEM